MRLSWTKHGPIFSFLDYVDTPLKFWIPWRDNDMQLLETCKMSEKQSDGKKHFLPNIPEIPVFYSVWSLFLKSNCWRMDVIVNIPTTHVSCYHSIFSFLSACFENCVPSVRGLLAASNPLRVAITFFINEFTSPCSIYLLYEDIVSMHLLIYDQIFELIVVYCTHICSQFPVSMLSSVWVMTFFKIEIQVIP